MTQPEELFPCLSEFKNSLQEVDILCDAAEAAGSLLPKYAVYNKAAILLLAGKFEAFSESAMEDFVFNLNKLKLPCQEIPEVIKLQHTFYSLQRLETIKPKHKHPEAVTVFAQLGKIWGSQEPFDSVSVDCRFRYGKHGQVELVKLFANIGIDDVFEIVRIVNSVENVATNSNVETHIDFRGIFNSVTSMRNNILHEDASPSLSTPSIRQNRFYFEDFAIKLIAHLVSMLPIHSDVKPPLNPTPVTSPQFPPTTSPGPDLPAPSS